MSILSLLRMRERHLRLVFRTNPLTTRKCSCCARTVDGWILRESSVIVLSVCPRVAFVRTDFVLYVCFVVDRSKVFGSVCVCVCALLLH